MQKQVQGAFWCASTFTNEVNGSSRLCEALLSVRIPFHNRFHRGLLSRDPLDLMIRAYVKYFHPCYINQHGDLDCFDPFGIHLCIRIKSRIHLIQETFKIHVFEINESAIIAIIAMDETNYTTEHRKGQHLLNEERHIIEVRYNKDNCTVYQIAKELGRPYNTKS